MLAHIFRVTYCLAAHKKKQHREGYLHLFKSNLVEADAAAVAAAVTTITAAAMSSVLPTTVCTPDAVDTPIPSSSPSTSVSFLKSQLYTDRGMLVDQQLGRSVMQYEESQTRPPPRVTDHPFAHSKRHRGWLGDEVDAGMEVHKKQRRAADDDGADATSDTDADASIDQDTASEAQIAATPSSASTMRNTFQVGEFVILGRYECELEEEIGHAEYEFTKKLMSTPQDQCRELDSSHPVGVLLIVAMVVLCVLVCLSRCALPCADSEALLQDVDHDHRHTAG
jgi:hypothetical protein